MDGTSDQDLLVKEDAETLIGKNSYFYLDNWSAHDSSFFKGWNWAAMFFSLEWMAYRKMYVEACLYFILTTLVTVCFGLLFEVLGIRFNSRLVGDAFRILIGALGNMMYWRKALRILNKTKDMDEFKRKQFLKDKGGVSVVGIFVCIAFEFAYLFLFL